MVEQNVEQETADGMHSVESALSSLWEKAREASLLISTLREEKRRLLQSIDELEEDLKHSKKEVEILQIQVEQVNAKSAAKNASVALDVDEKKLLQQKLRNVISKLDQYLTP